MQVGNLEQRNTRFGMSEQLQQDLKNNACFKCHKVGRPWKLRTGKANDLQNKNVRVINVESDKDDERASSEN